MRITRGQLVAGLAGYVVNLASEWTSDPIKNNSSGAWEVIWDYRQAVIIGLLLLAWLGLGARERQEAKSWSGLDASITPPLATADSPLHAIPEDADPHELVVFGNSAFVPAWNSAIQLMVDTRSQILRREGDRIEAMFQQIMERNGAAWRTLDARLREKAGELTLDQALADAYVHYELMVRWIKQGGEPHGLPAQNPHLNDWWKSDTRLLDKLSDLVGHPAFQSSALAKVFKEQTDSGIPKAIREKLQPKGASLEAKPLETSLDVDGEWRRLRVFNPNPFTAKRCCVQILEYEMPGRDDVQLPSKGFKFGWSTTNLDKPSRYIDIGPSAVAFADLHQLLAKQHVFTHVSPGGVPNEYRALWPLPAGAYSYVVNVVSEGDEGIPSHVKTIEVLYDGDAELLLEFRRSTVNLGR